MDISLLVEMPVTKEDKLSTYDCKLRTPSINHKGIEIFFCANVFEVTKISMTMSLKLLLIWLVYLLELLISFGIGLLLNNVVWKGIQRDCPDLRQVERCRLV